MQQSSQPSAPEEIRRAPAPEQAGMAVADELADVSRILADASDMETTLAATCQLAVDHVPGCEAAGIVLVVRGSMRSVGSTTPVVETVDDLQFRYSAGPAIDALKAVDVVKVDDLRTDPRWPSLGPIVVAATGVRSVLAHRLQARDRTLGVLTLHSTAPGAFDDGRVAHLASLFARHASLALAAAQAEDGLRAALDSRETISVAMGILMAREGLSRGQAFDVLRRASQRENVKLREIAARIAGGMEDVLPRG